MSDASLPRVEDPATNASAGVAQDAAVSRAQTAVCNSNMSGGTLDGSPSQVQDPHTPLASPARSAYAQESAVAESQAAVHKLVEQQTRLSQQIESIEGFGRGELTVEEVNATVKTFPLWDDSDLQAPYPRITAKIAKLEKEKENVMEQLVEAQKQKTLAMEAQLQSGGGELDVSNWHLNYQLKNYTIPYQASDESREDIEAYIKGALRFPSCLSETPLSACEDYAVNVIRSHTKMFYNAATMGMGKTRLHHELCRGVVEIHCGDNVSTKFVRFTYNENTGFKNDGTGLTFIKQLLQYHGLTKVEADKTRTLEAGFNIFINKLNADSAFAGTTTKVLCVCIDELHQGNDDAVIQSRLVKDLMPYQDTTLTNNERMCVRVLFLFSSLTEGLFRQMTTDSGRTAVCPPGRVPQLARDTIKRLLFEKHKEVKEKYEKIPFVKQLVDLSCDIPRAAFDGIPSALNNLVSDDQGKKVEALCRIMDTAQLVKYTTLLTAEIVAEFLVNRVIVKDAEVLMQAGLARKTEGGATQLIPLVMRAWAAHHSYATIQTSLPWFVDKAYDADCVVQKGSEVLAEKVLQNIEAAKLLSHKLMDTRFQLKEFYSGGSCHGLPSYTYASTKFQGIRVVEREELEDFDTDNALKGGYIVVFPDGEPALEHIVPFQKNESSEFAFGGAQVKMIKNRANKTLEDLATSVKGHSAMKGKGCRFPVLYTTDAREDLSWKTYGVAFNHIGLENFTQQFGPLRLTYEKKQSGGDPPIKIAGGKRPGSPPKGSAKKQKIQ
ncbi:hypothetical protein DIPPA_70214 [Diplonema papillatum]|nr:hypothetical protein DIPPA_70214 [Diplonema papillatum]